MKKMLVSRIFKSVCFVFLFALFASEDVAAKAPPPGSGTADIPANILIALDTSGSMSEYLPGGDSKYPMDMAFDSQGNLFIAKYYDTIEKYNSNEEFVTSWGEYNNTSNPGKFDLTYAIAIDSSDNVYVADHLHGRIQKFDNDGNYISQIDTAGGTIYGLEIDKDNNIYAVNSNNNIAKYNSSGTLLQTWTSYSNVTHIAIDEVNNRVILAREDSKRINIVSKTGTSILSITTSFEPYGVDVDASGNFYVSSSSGNKVYKYNSSGSQVASYGSNGSSVGKWREPKGVEFSPANNKIYVADFRNHRIQSLENTLLINGGQQKTRLQAAQEVIKKIVSDSDLTDGANFGLMTWNSSATMRVNVSDTGASSIYSMIDSLTANGGTYLDNTMNLAQSYFTGPSSPINANAPCQQTILIVISDGYWVDTTASSDAAELFNNNKIKTFAIGFTTTANDNYVTLSQNGGTYPDSPLFAENEGTLLNVLSNYIRQIISTQLTFTVPTIIPGITNSDHILQSTFMFKENNQWKGRLYKYEIASDGGIGDLIWDAGDLLNEKTADSRNIWTAVTAIPQNINNFTIANYQRLQPNIDENQSTALTRTEIESLIQFVRGKDSYGEFPSGVDDEGETLITGERWKLGDIYHSRAAAVPKPSAYFSDEAKTYTESYYRAVNGYKNFRDGATCGGSCVSRKEMIYVGANDGMLHAFNSTTGQEEWAFIPPSVLPNLRDMISTESGKSVSVYGVDGSPVVKDIFYGNSWKTVLLSGTRQGGKSYFALDITDPNNPKHLFTFSNNKYKNKISYWNSSGIQTDYSLTGTIPAAYDYSKLGESWSDPLILNITIGGVKKWVGVFAGGYSNNITSGYGSSVYVIDMEDGGKVLKVIDLSDSSATNGIANSAPAKLTAITADSTTTFNKAGAHIYFTDLEGYLWKINLSDSGTLYATQKVFSAESSFDNDRLTFQQTTPSILNDGRLINYFGTADMMRIGRTSSSIQNRAYGIIDNNYPNYNVVSTPKIASNLTNATAMPACSGSITDGWYINLNTNEKITSSAAVRGGNVIFSRYTPDSLNLCEAGSSKISEHAYSCGAPQRTTNLGVGMATEAIVYKNKIYIGISSDAEDTGTLPAGFVKQGNLIIGEPIADVIPEVKIEKWKENY